MDNKRRFYENCTRDLVSAITGFEDHEENYQICLDFALSHFMSTDLPDVNWFQVKKRIYGLCERYMIDSHLEKSKKLKALTDALFEELSCKPVPVKGTFYSALSLLCSLCGAASKNVSTPVEETKKDLNENEVDNSDAFDWISYLCEDNIPIYECSDDDDEESILSDCESMPDVSLTFLNSPEPTSVDSGIGGTPDACTAPPFPPLGPFQPYEEPSLPSETSKLQTPYWNSRYQSFRLKASGDDSKSCFTAFWEEHLAKNLPIYTPETNVVLTERNVLREILWMLHGVKTTFMFAWINNEFKVRKHVHFSHLTEGTLYKMLASLCAYGAKVVHLQEFISGMVAEDDNNANKCFTYKAYAKGLQRCLNQYAQHLTSYEKIIIDQSKPMTIIQLTSSLGETLEFLQLLYSIHKKAVDSVPLSSSSFCCATILLDSLWKEVRDCSLWMKEKSFQQSILMLFLSAFHPYLCIFKELVIHGELTDFYSEFILQRNKNIGITHENFWKEGFIVQILPDSVHNYFLSSVVDDIAIASLSMQMVKTLDCFFDTECYVKYNKDYLFTEFAAKCETLYRNEIHKIELLNNCEEDDICEKDKDFCGISSSCQKEFENPAHHSYNLIMERDFCIDLERSEKLPDEILNLIQPGSLLLLDDVLERTLLPAIKDTCSFSKKILVDALKDKYFLMKHVAAMRKYFLMESGHLMFSFYVEIFEKIFHGEDWCNNTFINHIFQDAISDPSCKDDERFLLYIKDSENGNDGNSPLSQLCLLNLIYNVEWPINVILNQAVQKIYCDVFCFLMQVKCAKYGLDILYCHPLKPSHKPVPKVAQWWTRKADVLHSQAIHAMHILRMKLLHFINGLHSYIMTSILYSSGLELDLKLKDAESLGEVLLYLQDYVSRLQEQCFLDTKHPYLQEQIHGILNLAVKFQALWKSEAENISIVDLQSIEQEYISRVTLVTSYLKKPWKRGEHLHLEILSSAISTNCHLQRLFI